MAVNRSDGIFVALLGFLSGFMFVGLVLGIAGIIMGYWVGVATLSAGIICMVGSAALMSRSREVIPADKSMGSHG